MALLGILVFSQVMITDITEEQGHNQKHSKGCNEKVCSIWRSISNEFTQISGKLNQPDDINTSANNAKQQANNGEGLVHNPFYRSGSGYLS